METCFCAPLCAPCCLCLFPCRRLAGRLTCRPPLASKCRRSSPSVVPPPSRLPPTVDEASSRVPPRQSLAGRSPCRPHHAAFDFQRQAPNRRTGRPRPFSTPWETAPKHLSIVWKPFSPLSRLLFLPSHPGSPGRLAPPSQAVPSPAERWGETSPPSRSRRGVLPPIKWQVLTMLFNFRHLAQRTPPTPFRPPCPRKGLPMVPLKYGRALALLGAFPSKTDTGRACECTPL